MTQIPPGLEGELKFVVSGGEGEWQECPPFKHYTNVFIWNEDTGKILLGYKKRGFAKDMYNGFGGKVEPGETPIEAAARELQEEAGITANLEACGILLFVSEGQNFAHYIHMFRSNTYEGTITESDEMRPEWFALPDEHRKVDPQLRDELLPIPFDMMWADDRIWMPLLLAKDYFVGRADFKRRTDAQATFSEHELTMTRWWFGKKAWA